MRTARLSIFGKEYLVLAVIFLLSVFLRVHVDPGMPFHYDPGKNIVYARAALQWFPLVPQYNPYFNLGEYYEYQVLFPYTVAFLHKLSGISLITITNWVAVISGAALSLTVYYLSLELSGSKTSALISAFLVSVSKIQLIGYMNYYPQIMAMTLMPLAFVFLIRYVKYGKSGHLAITAMISSLVVLASYIAALVYFIILIISVGIYSIKSRKALRILVLIPLVTGLLLSFFWLPMIWRHGVMQFSGTFIDRILYAPAPFTNQPWTLMSFITFSSATVLSLVLGILAIFFIKRFKWDFSKLLIAVWLVITFILSASYYFRPVLWVDRFFQFFDIALLLAAGSIMFLLIAKLNSTGSRYKGYLLLLLLVFPLYGALNVDFAFGKWGYPSDFSMLEYMTYLPPGSLVAAPPSLHSFWVPALSGVNVLGGESSQMLGHRYFGDNDSNTIINSPDVEQKMNVIRKYGVNYIYVPLHRPANMIWNPDLDRKGVETFNNSTYFEINKIFNDPDGATYLIKVREKLKPQYNVEKIDWNVTIAGYLLSLATLLALIYILKSDISKSL
ncbi:MAG: hypothetical protein FIB08_06020 [Candidatus Methanoperedens sp.]|nr:hypothetical protein [Candidatus Methanoperedens sp.]